VIEYPRDYCSCFDYPIAWGQYRCHCQEYHHFDPGDCEPPEKEEQREVFINEPELNRNFRKEIEQLKARNNHLQEQVSELQKKRKHYAKY